MTLPRQLRLVASLCFIAGALLLSPGRLIPATKDSVTVDTDNSLRAITERLYCADNQYEAEHHLRQLQQKSLLTPGLPDESDSSDEPELRATTLDKVLQVLSKTAGKFPKNKPLVQQTVTQWNFCSVIDNGTLYDHRVSNNKTVRYPSSVAKQNVWSGFQAFGLLPNQANRNTGTPFFDYTTPYTNTVIRSLADRKLKQHYIAHCLPHPDDEHLYRNFGRNAISRLVPRTTEKSPLQETEWKLECQTEAPVLAYNDKSNNKSTFTNPENETQTQAAQEITELPVLAAALTSQHAPEETTETVPLPMPTTEPELKPEPEPEPEPEPQRSVPTSVVVPIPASIPNAITVTEATTPRSVTGPWSGNGVIASDTKLLQGLSGSITLNNSGFLSRNTSVNLAFSYKPVKDSYWFVRSSVNISQESKPLSYTWGIGYDDWHAGTWAVQLNHWGPLKPGDGLDIENAVAEISYKFKQPWLSKHNLSSSISLTKPLSSNAALNWGWSWNPYTQWFVRSTIMRPLGESGLNWSYGFGYTRYTNKSLSFEYNNWGPNEFPQRNFRKNALLSLIYRWAF